MRGRRSSLPSTCSVAAATLTPPTAPNWISSSRSPPDGRGASFRWYAPWLISQSTSISPRIWSCLCDHFRFGENPLFEFEKEEKFYSFHTFIAFFEIPADRTTKPFTSNSARTNSLLTKLVHFSSDFALESFGFVGDGTDAFLILMKLRSSCSPNP